MKSRKLIVLPVFIALLASSAYGFYSWGQQPAVSTDAQDLHDTSNVLGANIRLNPWQTSYFSTRLPSYLRSNTSSEDSSKPIIGSYVLTSSQTGQDDQVAVTIGRLGLGSLDELSAVKLRQAMPAEYTPAQLTYAPAGAIAFSKVSAYETSVFWQHGTTYAAVVVSGTSSHQPDLDEALSSIVSNWQWQ